MAISNNGTNLVGAALTEATALGATIPSNTVLSDPTHQREETVEVAKSGVENSDAATTFDALVAAVDTALDTETSNDYDAANTVTTQYDILSISLRTKNKYQTTPTETYVVKCLVKVKVA